MDSLKMNTKLGTKWFTFFTKVRPWLGCLGVFTILTDFLEYTEVYLSYWWLMLYLIISVCLPILSIMVFVKSKGDYCNFVSFVKKVLMFEVVGMSVKLAIEQYLQNDLDLIYAIVMFVVAFLISYFIWYRLNVKYFEKRLLFPTNPSTNINTDFFDVTNEKLGLSLQNCEVKFCRKCGNKLLDGAKFCNKCGTKVINEDG